MEAISLILLAMRVDRMYFQDHEDMPRECITILYSTKVIHCEWFARQVCWNWAGQLPDLQELKVDQQQSFHHEEHHYRQRLMQKDKRIDVA